MHKKVILLFLIGLIFSEANAQIKKHTLGFQGGIFSQKPPRTLHDPVAKLEISQAVGLLYRYQFSKRIGAETGILYRKEYVENLAYLTSMEIDLAWVKMRHNFLQVPVQVVVKLNQKEEANWQFNVLLGGSGQKYLGSNVIYPSNSNRKTREWGQYRLPNIYVFANAGVEIGYNFNEKYTLWLSPSYRYQLFKQHRDNGFYGLVKFGRNF